MKFRRWTPLFVLAAAVVASAQAQPSERDFLSRVRRLTIEGRRSGEGYWSRDGKQLVFTGYDGGISDLFIVNRDGSDLRRLTNDKYADLHPVWSPDGRTIAFATDRGPGTDFRTLAVGNFRLAGGILDHGFAARQHRSHQKIFGSRH